MINNQFNGENLFVGIQEKKMKKNLASTRNTSASASAATPSTTNTDPALQPKNLSTEENFENHSANSISKKSTRWAQNLFHRSESSPVTASEQTLVDFGKKTFLNLWAYPNPILRHGTNLRDSVELCDLLVVFGKDVIIFSDKEITFEPEPKKQKPLSTLWSRWERKAITKSVDQLKGAARNLRNFPDRIFSDLTLTHQIKLPPTAEIKFHFVATCRGAGPAIQKRMARKRYF